VKSALTSEKKKIQGLFASNSDFNFLNSSAKKTALKAWVILMLQKISYLSGSNRAREDIYSLPCVKF